MKTPQTKIDTQLFMDLQSYFAQKTDKTPQEASLSRRLDAKLQKIQQREQYTEELYSRQAAEIFK